MKNSWQYRFRMFMLPGLKRWILFILVGIASIVFGVLLVLRKQPIRSTLDFFQDTLKGLSEALLSLSHNLPHKISGIIAITIGSIIIFVAIARLTVSILGAYLPDDRESIPDMLFRRRHLQKGPKVVVIGGGHGLANLLRGLKGYTNNITAIVTVGDDGGSSGRLRAEMGVLPPGDIRNCITALADEDRLVTDLFQYRFDSKSGLEGHSFGNLFLAAVCAITAGDMLEAARVACRVLNSCGQVLPSTLVSMTLIAELEDGRVITGESHIGGADGRIKRLTSQPQDPEATPEALAAIAEADLIILGPGSLYTSIIPNLLVKGIPEAITQSPARKIYVCNVMTQKGETTNYTVTDHVLALLANAGIGTTQANLARGRFLDGVMVNIEAPQVTAQAPAPPATSQVRYDPERLRETGVRAILRPLVSTQAPSHHDATRLSTAIMLWFLGKKTGRFQRRPGRSEVISLASAPTPRKSPRPPETTVKTESGQNAPPPSIPRK